MTAPKPLGVLASKWNRRLEYLALILSAILACVMGALGLLAWAIVRTLDLFIP